MIEFENWRFEVIFFHRALCITLSCQTLIGLPGKIGSMSVTEIPDLDKDTFIELDEYRQDLIDDRRLRHRGANIYDAVAGMLTDLLSQMRG